MMRPLIAALAVLALTACGSMNVPTPQSPAQSAYAAHAMYVVTSNLTADLVRQGTISPEQARDIQGQLQNYKPVVVSSIEMARDGEVLPEDRVERLRTVQNQLMKIQRRLEQERSQ